MSRIDGVGVAFCGGGFRSYAEVAAVEDIERNAIRIGAAAGTSMGSLVAVLVGAGLSSSRIAELLVKMDQRVVDEGILKNIGFKALGFLGGGHGLVESATLERFARDLLEEAGIRTMADMVMPVAFPACDITSGDLCVFTNDESLFSNTSGGWTCITGNLDIARCVAASASYPLVISPTEYLGRTFMDGGCRMNLPTPLFDRTQVDAVVGVGLIRHAQPTSDLSPISIAKRTMSCGANQLDRIYSQVADIYINLPVSGDDAFQAGTGQQVIAEARQMIADKPIDWSPARPTTFEVVRRTAVDAFYHMVRTHSN